MSEDQLRDLPTYRRVERSDHRAVTEICSKVFAGNDYVAKLFHENLTNPNVIFLAQLAPPVTKADEQPTVAEICGFLLITLIDQGETAFLSGLRLSEKYLGRGYAKLLLEHSLKVVRENFPTAKVIRETVHVDSKLGAPIRLALGLGLSEAERFPILRIQAEFLKKFRMTLPPALGIKEVIIPSEYGRRVADFVPDIATSYILASNWYAYKLESLPISGLKIWQSLSPEPAWCFSSIGSNSTYGRVLALHSVASNLDSFLAITAALLDKEEQENGEVNDMELFVPRNIIPFLPDDFFQDNIEYYRPANLGVFEKIL